MSEEQEKTCMDLFIRCEKQCNLANDRESMDKRINCGRESLNDKKGDKRLIRTVGQNKTHILSEIM